MRYVGWNLTGSDWRPVGLAVMNTVLDHRDPCKRGLSEEELCCTELTQFNRPILCFHPALRTVISPVCRV